MKNNLWTKGIVIGIIILFFGASVSIVPLVKADGPVHNDDTGQNFNTIQAAIDNASIGDTIRVYSGTYPESIIVPIPELTFLGVGEPVLQGDGLAGGYAGWFQQAVTFDGFRVSNPVGNGLYVSSDTSLNVFTNCNFSGNDGCGLNIANPGAAAVVANNWFTGNNYGVRVMEDVAVVNIHDNTFMTNNVGIYLWTSAVCTISHNILSSNGWGIKCEYSNYNNINTNTLNGNTYGIECFSSSFNTIYNNYFSASSSSNAWESGGSHNFWNISETSGINIIGGLNLGGNYWDDYTGVDSNSDGIGDTNVPYTNGMMTGGDYLPLTNVQSVPPAVIYVDDDNTAGPWDGTIDHPYLLVSDGLFNADAGDTIFVFSGTYQSESSPYVDKPLTIIGENKETTILWNCQISILANDVTIHGFTFTYGDEYKQCIHGMGVSGLLIYDNIFTWNAQVALMLDACSDCTIRNNNFSNNQAGLILYLSNGNTIYNNYFSENTQNAYEINSDLTNMWYNATLQEGNYWSDYTGVDTNGDGIGDTPYNIPYGSNQDLYPLMYPWGAWGDFDYQLFNGGTEVEITGYHGSGGDVVIPGMIEGKSVTSIGDNAFYYCTSLTSITIPDSVTIIGNYAFAYCESLTSVTIGSGVTSIGQAAFYYCTSLTSITFLGLVAPTSVGANWIQDTPAEIRGHAYVASNFPAPGGVFNGLTMGEPASGDYTYTVDGGVATITGYTGTGIDIAIPSILGGCPVVTIGDNAFNSVNGHLITSVIIPDSVTGIGVWAFAYCSSLTSVTIGSNVTTIGDYAFAECASLTSITIPNNVTSIGYAAFVDCTALTSVTFTPSSSVMSIGFYAFDSCTALTSITIPDSVTFIGDSAFQYCFALASVTIGSSVTHIGDYAFEYCTALTSIIIPDSVTRIGYCAFAGCASLTSINVAAGNLIYSNYAGDGVLYNKAITTLIQCPGGKTGVFIIPDCVMFLGGSAFLWCTSLTSVTIPDSVIGISAYAFSHCWSMTPITIPANVTEIGFYAFEYCTALTSITFLGLIAPTTVGANWIQDTPAGIRGHAYAASNFPAPGDDFNGLTMGTVIVEIYDVYVDDNYDESTPGWGYDHFNTIQNGIDGVAIGGFVNVNNGVYNENVVVDKPVQLYGQDRDNTIVDGGNNTNTFTVTASHVVINGFKITNGNSVYPNAGIFLDHVEGSIINNNNVSGNNGHGIFVMWGTGNQIFDNILSNNRLPNIRIDGFEAHARVANNTIQYSSQESGLFLYNAHDVIIENNTVSYNDVFGISLQGNCSNITIRNNDVMNNVMSGIFLYWIYDTLIEYNTISYNGQHGIGLAGGSERITIQHNTIVENGAYGINIDGSPNNNIYENTLTGNLLVGIYLKNSNTIQLLNNILTSDGLFVRNSYDNTITGNTVNSKPLVYLENAVDQTIDDAGQIILVNCDTVEIENLDLSNADVGLELWQTSHVFAVNNNFTNNRYYGVVVANSSDNIFYHNNFSNNLVYQVYIPSYASVSSNTWDNGYPSGGNYWDNYTGVDTKQGVNQDESGADGFGDTPFVINANNQDHYPLMDTQMIVFADTPAGTATFRTNFGDFTSFNWVDETSLPPEAIVTKPIGLNLPFGLFNFTIAGLNPGQVITLTIELPDVVRTGSLWWKVNPANTWYSLPIGSDDGDNIITINVTDGGLGDNDGMIDEKIVDPGGIGLPQNYDIYVDDNAASGWYDATHVHTIQEGINNASVGNTIFIYNGTYAEYVVVNKQVSIVGENRDATTLISPNPGYYNGIYINSGVDHVSVQNIKIVNFSLGVYIDGVSSFDIIANNDIRNCANGVRFWSGSIHDCMIANNTFTDCNYYNAIQLYGAGTSSNNTISGNTFTTAGGHDAIRLENILYTTVKNNNITGPSGIYILGGSDHTTIMGNTIQTPSPVYLTNSGYATISENTLTVPWYGGNCIDINTNNEKKLTITGNTLTGYTGIVANSITNSEFVGNTIASGQYGIYLGASQRNTVENNTIMPQSSTAGPYGMYLTGSHNNTVSNNSFKPNPVFAGSHIGHGMQLDSCNTNEVLGNTLRNCSGSAIYVSGGSHDNTLHLNTITGSMRGFYVSNGPTQNNMSSNSISGSTDGGVVLQSASLNTIQGNTITNGNYGLELIDSTSGCTLTDNKVIDNNYGVWIRNSAGNFIYHNDFVGTKTQQISQPSDTVVNTWDNGYPSGGNYWSNYAGVDVKKGSAQTDPGADGIGDTPFGTTYGMVGANKDNYPFMTIFFNQTGVGSDFTSGAIFKINGTNYTAPVSFMWSSSSTHSFQFNSPLVVTANAKRYVWTNTSGLSTSQSSSSFVVPFHGSVTGNYKTQYYLATTTNFGSVSPVSSWFDAGSTVTLQATAPASGPGERYVWVGWVGSGPGHYSGPANPATNLVTMNGPITEAASWTHQYSVSFAVSPVGAGSTSPSGSLWYDAGFTITPLTATPNPGYRFSSWGSDTSSIVFGSSGSSSTTATIGGTGTITASFTQNEYTLTVTPSGSGSVAKLPDQVTYHYNDVVQLNATADLGWHFDHWGGNLSGAINPTTITIDGNKTVTATFVHNEYTLIVTPSGSGTLQKDPDQATYHYNDIVQLTANASIGWHFDHWTGDLTGSTNPASITINGNKTVTAYFVVDNQPPYQPSSPTPLNGATDISINADLSWTGGDPDGNPVTYDVYFGTTNPPTKVIGNQSATTYDLGALAYSMLYYWKIVAWDDHSASTPGPVWSFTTQNENEYTFTITKSGTGFGTVERNNTGPYYNGAKVKLWANASINSTFTSWSGDLGGTTTPQTLVMDGDKTVNAQFTLKGPYTLALTTSGSGSGTIQASPGGPYYYGAVVTIWANASVGSTFAGFSGGLSGTATPQILTMTGNKNVDAGFTLNGPYSLSITKGGTGFGSVEVNNSGPYYYGAKVKLWANASTGSTFAGWSGDLSGITSPQTLTMTGAKNVDAGFTLNGPYALSITKSGTGSGTVEVNNSGPYYYGAKVKLWANASTGSTFAGWSGDLSGLTTPQTLTMNGNKNVNAGFTLNGPYNLVLMTSGSGSGTIQASPGGPYYYGAVVTIWANVSVGSAFAGFSGDLSGTVTPQILTMNNNKAVTANFTQDEYSISLTIYGSGTVGKQPDALTYHYNDTVQLTANAGIGWYFDSWSGDLTGTTNPAMITIDGNKAVTATFTENPPTNHPPVANAGPNQTVFVTATVQLNGAGSSDVDGDPLTYSWSFVSKPAGSAAVLSNPTMVNPTFMVDKSGVYVLQLIVNDGTVDSTPDMISVSTMNQPPVANAGPDQTVLVGATVTLNGAGSSDADGDPLTYAWSFVSKPLGSAAVLSDATVVNPTFVADRSGSYVVQLIVNDGIVNSAPDTVSLSTMNQPPYEPNTPNPADGAQDVSLNTVLSWTGGDPDSGDSVSYDVYFGPTNPPQKRVGYQSATTYDSGTLTYNTQYYWQIIAWDNHGAIAASPIWQFTTQTATNHPPNVPGVPSGPVSLVLGITGKYFATTTDSDGDLVQYQFDWNASGSHRYTEWTSLVGSGGSGNKTCYYWVVPGTYVVKARARDEHGLLSAWSTSGLTVTVAFNLPPGVPGVPSGPVSLVLGITGKYFATTTDSDGDLVQYQFDWNASGSHRYTEWTSLVGSGGSGNKTCYYWVVPGTYVVKARARDEHGLLSAWSTSGLTVTVAFNLPPGVPGVPSGPVSLVLGITGKYFATTTDSDSDLVQYQFDWNASGSHRYTEWTSLVGSGGSGNKTCYYWVVPGTYVVKARARDEHGLLSAWSSGLTVIVT